MHEAELGAVIVCVLDWVIGGHDGVGVGGGLAVAVAVGVGEGAGTHCPSRIETVSVGGLNCP